MTELWAPRRDEDLWLALGTDVNPARPIFTGDVFLVDDIPGVDPDESGDCSLAMIVAHPCAMREGPRLRPRFEMGRIVVGRPIEATAWGHNKTRMPLPGLADPELTLSDGKPGQYQLALDLIGRVDASSISPFQRRACMSEAGIAALLQRRTWRQTQYIAEHEAFVMSNEHVMQEAELQEEWNESLIPELVEMIKSAPLAAIDALEREAHAFSDLLDQQRELPHSGKKAKTHTYRGDLLKVGTRSTARVDIRRAMREERKRRTENPPDAGAVHVPNGPSIETAANKTSEPQAASSPNGRLNETADTATTATSASPTKAAE